MFHLKGHKKVLLTQYEDIFTTCFYTLKDSLFQRHIKKINCHKKINCQAMWLIKSLL